MKLKNYKSDKPCIACGEARDGYVCFHHVKTQGSGGSDHPHNLMSVCSIHHELVHKSLSKFSILFPKAREWLISNGWQIDSMGGKFEKWFHPIEPD
jgi:hypothetical protein